MTGLAKEQQVPRPALGATTQRLRSEVGDDVFRDVSQIPVDLFQPLGNLCQSLGYKGVARSARSIGNNAAQGVNVQHDLPTPAGHFVAQEAEQLNLRLRELLPEVSAQPGGLLRADCTLQSKKPSGRIPDLYPSISDLPPSTRLWSHRPLTPVCYTARRSGFPLNPSKAGSFATSSRSLTTPAKSSKPC